MGIFYRHPRHSWRLQLHANFVGWIKKRGALDQCLFLDLHLDLRLASLVWGRLDRSFWSKKLTFLAPPKLEQRWEDRSANFELVLDRDRLVGHWPNPRLSRHYPLSGPWSWHAGLVDQLGLHSLQQCTGMLQTKWVAGLPHCWKGTFLKPTFHCTWCPRNNCQALAPNPYPLGLLVIPLWKARHLISPLNLTNSPLIFSEFAANF